MTEISRRPNRPVADTSDDDDNGSPLIRGGWTEATKQAEAASDYAQALRLEQNVQIIKFLEDAPYASYKRHWVDRNGPSGPTKRAYVCFKTVNRSCPLCNIGNNPQAVSAFNVAVIGDEGQAILRSWDLGVKILNVIKAFHNDPKVGPLTKGFFAVSKTGGRGGAVQTNIFPVKASALYEDYSIVAPTTEDLALDLYTSDIIRLPKLSDMEEVASELATGFAD
jgi:hypothetical protein